jgi:hypothetical protein
VDAASKAGEGGYNPRRMRRIIVEDPEWNRIPVPSLLELCLKMVKSKKGGRIRESVDAAQRPKGHL